MNQEYTEAIATFSSSMSMATRLQCIAFSILRPTGEVANAAGDAFGPAAVVRGQEGDWTDTSLTLRGGPKDGSGNFVRLPDEMLIGAESAT